MNDHDRYAEHYGEGSPVPPVAPAESAPLNEAPPTVAAPSVGTGAPSNGCADAFRWCLFLPMSFSLLSTVEGGGGGWSRGDLRGLLVAFAGAPVVFIIAGAVIVPRGRFAVALVFASVVVLRALYVSSDTPVPPLGFAALAVAVLASLGAVWYFEPGRLALLDRRENAATLSGLWRALRWLLCVFWAGLPFGVSPAVAGSSLGLVLGFNALVPGFYVLVGAYLSPEDRFVLGVVFGLVFLFASIMIRMATTGIELPFVVLDLASIAAALSLLRSRRPSPTTGG